MERRNLSHFGPFRGWYTRPMKPKTRPSYETGRLNDPHLDELMDRRAPDKKTAHDAVIELIKRATRRRPA